jgi:DNA repair photolyase
LGLGIDCSDSLLYEGVTGYARALIPIFAEQKTNPFNRHLILLTKSANVHYLKGLPTKNTVVSFSLNPQEVADIFEGRYPDGLRITPSINTRLEASKACEDMGFETRWRIDPIIPIEGWQDTYRTFFNQVTAYRPRRITLGIYRQMGRGLKTFSEKWGLTPMPWEPPFKLTRDIGLHYQLPRSLRIEIYQEVKRMVHETWPPPVRPELSLCKEIGEARRASGITSRRCNCE